MLLDNVFDNVDNRGLFFVEAIMNIMVKID